MIRGVCASSKGGKGESTRKTAIYYTVHREL